jgi:4-diphosphocytidyl-2-C-methyl-D-erythritol kinase
MPTVRLRAPAKINLSLRILGRRPDGYHELRTVFQSVSLCDELEVDFTTGGRRKVRLDCDVPELNGPSNLAYRAADELLATGNWRGSVAIRLKKKIPSGAGLGGGSSDAGAVLRALARLLMPAPRRQDLFEVAARLGSDIPYFLTGGRAVGVGRGEEVYPLPDVPKKWGLIVAPGIHVATPEAYAEWSRRQNASLTQERRQIIISSFCSGIRVPEEAEGKILAEPPANDFEEVVFRKIPELANWKQRLLDLGADVAMMSGSGSVLFGLFADRARAREAESNFGPFAGSIFHVSTLGRKPFHRISGAPVQPD